MARTHKDRKSKRIKQPRNWAAVYAHFKSGTGDHGDKRKQQSRDACRKPVEL